MEGSGRMCGLGRTVCTSVDSLLCMLVTVAVLERWFEQWSFLGSCACTTQTMGNLCTLV